MNEIDALEFEMNDLLRRVELASAQLTDNHARMMSGMADISAAMLPLLENIARAFRKVEKPLKPIIRELQRQGVIDGYPPQHNYRQTKRGRVPRLTPVIRAKKREIRERRRQR